MDTDETTQSETAPKQSHASGWRSLSSIERRILGVMVEKSKTTPDIYPMTINAIVTASNQKSNRKPQMHLTADDVQDSLDSLREAGVVTEIQGDGRALKFKHHLYVWLGVERVELAVLAELLLRGEQTVGDLRGRASRMEKITGVAELKPMITTLMEKNLVIALTAPGRGQMVTHNLYLPEQLAKLRGQYGETAGAVGPSLNEPGLDVNLPRSEPAAESVSVLGDESVERWGQLQTELDALRARVARLEALLES